MKLKSLLRQALELVVVVGMSYGVCASSWRILIPCFLLGLALVRRTSPKGSHE